MCFIEKLTKTGMDYEKKRIFAGAITTESHVREINQRLPLDFVGRTDGRDAGVYHARGGGGSKTKQ